jgi:hypothetical protein
MAEENMGSKIKDSLATIITTENIQKYVLGTKKSGQPRAIYDLVKDYVGSSKKKKKDKKKDKSGSSFDLYVKTKKGKKKSKKKDKYWHI